MGLEKSDLGLALGLNAAMIVVLEIPLNAATLKWSHARALALGALLTALGFGATAFAPNFSVLLLTIVVWTFGEMILLPAAGAYAAEVAPEGQRGRYMGLYQVAFSFSASFAPWIGVRVFEAHGAPVLWIACGVLGAISAIGLQLTTGSARARSGAD
jgi:MFS family permease